MKMRQIKFVNASKALLEGNLCHQMLVLERKPQNNTLSVYPKRLEKKMSKFTPN